METEIPYLITQDGEVYEGETIIDTSDYNKELKVTGFHYHGESLVAEFEDGSTVAARGRSAWRDIRKKDGLK